MTVPIEKTEHEERARTLLSDLAPHILEFRRHLHCHPELSLREFLTSAYIADQLKAAGIRCRLGTGERGVIADIGSSQEGQAIALRADCDALPITEESAAPYASRNPGVMHACGHDAHTAILLGTLIALHRAELPFTVRGIFQPAEEQGDGALGMIADGALENVSRIIALHVDPNVPADTAAVVPGVQTASCQDFTITVKGRGGHAARPHLTVDPIAIAAALVTQIYQSIPRGVDSRLPLVVSVCRFHAGAALNVIPESAELGGTIRALSDEAATKAHDLLEQLSKGTAAMHGAEIQIQFQRRIPASVNDLMISTACAEAAGRVPGIRHVVREGSPGLGAEDFADFLQYIPGCQMRIGVKIQGRPVTPLHTPNFDIDEAALLRGARLLLESTFNLTSPLCS